MNNNNLLIEDYDIFKNINIECTYKMSNKSLEKLYTDLFNKKIINAHNAMIDVESTYECYKKLKLQQINFSNK